MKGKARWSMIVVAIWGLGGCGADADISAMRRATWALIDALNPTLTYFFNDDKSAYQCPAGGRVESGGGAFKVGGTGHVDAYIYSCVQAGITIDSPNGVVFSKDADTWGIHGTVQFSGGVELECKYSSVDKMSATTWVGSICGHDANEVMHATSQAE